MTTFDKELKLFGLSDKEISIFITLLKDDMTAYQIHKELKIQRTSIYPLLTNLLEKGLVLEKTIGCKKIYSTISQQSFNELVEEKVASLKNLKAELPEFIKQFRGISKQRQLDNYVIYK